MTDNSKKAVLPPRNPSHESAISTGEGFILAFLTLAALLLRLLRIFDLDLWFDEVAILFQTEYTYAGIWNFCKIENFPPLYPWLVKLWESLFPGDEAVRISSAITGALVVPVAYCLGRQVADKKFALLLAISCTLSIPFLYYSQVIRMYILFVLFACLSYIGFLRALQTHHWKYWLWVAIANLLAFYTFLFTVFIVASEFLLLIWYFRLDYKKYLRPAITHAPTFILMAFWVLTLYHRFKVQQTYVSPVLFKSKYLELWTFLGTGLNFRSQLALIIAFNLPFGLGFLLSIPSWFKKKPLFVLAFIFVASIAMVIIISGIGSSIMVHRYLIYLVPIYLALALFGWYSLEHKLLRRIGLTSIFLVLLISVVYYYSDYLMVHDNFRSKYHIETSDGHSFSTAAQFITDEMRDQEIILHYSHLLVRSFTFFPFIYYHGRELPEYLYSKFEVPESAGIQYIRPGERIESLTHFDPLPRGVWVVTLARLELFEHLMSDADDRERSWTARENLLRELYENGYRKMSSTTFGDLTVLHYQRDS